jgi:hypothetical protein
MEFIMNASADYSITNPQLGLSRGSGRVKAAQADQKHANVNYALFKAPTGYWIIPNPLRVVLREIDKAIEYRTQRKVNPQLFEDALTTEIGILRMSMIGKAFLGTWVDPEQEKLFYEQTRRERLDSFKRTMQFA